MPPGGLGKIALRAMPVRLASSPNGLGVAALWVEFPPDPLRVAAQCFMPKPFAFSAQNTVPPFRASQSCPFFMSWNGKRPPLVFLHAEPEASVREQSAAAPVVFHAKPGNFAKRQSAAAPQPFPDPFTKVFGRGGGGLEGAGEAFLQKSSPAPSKSFSISLPIPNYSCTTQGRPRRLSCSMNGSGSSCSMFQTPGCIHLPVTIIMAPIMAGTPVV